MNFDERQLSRLSNKSKREDALDKFWNFLELTGIRSDSAVSKYCPSRNKKAVACSIFMIMTYTWMMVLNVWHLISKKPFEYFFIPYALVDVVAIMMHLSLRQQSKKLATLKKLTRLLSERSKIKYNYFFVYFMIAALFVKSTIVAFAYPIFDEKFKDHFTMYYRFEDDRVAYFFCVVNMFSCTIVFHFMHAIFCIIYCVVCHRWAKIISVLRENVQDAFSRRDNETDISDRLFQRCLAMSRGVDVIREAFSAFLFFWILKQCFSMFSWTSIVMRKKDKGVYVDFETKLNFLVANALFVAIVFYASKIPDEMEELKKCFVRIRELRALESHLPDGGGVTDRRIDLLADKMITPLTVGGFADLNKSFIFLVYSNLITYGLLLISIYPGEL